MSTVDYGTDVSCTDDLHIGRMVSGLELLAEAVYRRLTTPRGMLIDDPDYGYDVRSLLGAAATTRGLAAIPGIVRGEVLKDPRISACVVVASFFAGILTIELACTASSGEPFPLVLAVSAVTVERLRR